MLSLLSPTFSVDAGHGPVDPLELLELELPVLELPVLELPVLELPVLELPVLELPVLELPVLDPALPELDPEAEVLLPLAPPRPPVLLLVPVLDEPISLPGEPQAMSVVANVIEQRERTRFMETPGA
jgi:hypothetical protein